MKKLIWLIAVCCLFAAACSKEPATAPASTPMPEWKTGYRVYVTNESSGDMTIIDGTTDEVIATVPLGKRPRGIHASPDGKTIYVALSGSPAAPPGVDESTLPPPDKSADGIGVFDVETNKLLRVIQGGSDPENFDIASDGSFIVVSNEDISAASFIDIASGKVTDTIGGLGEEPEGVRLSPDGSRAYVTSESEGSIAVIDVKTRKLITTFKVGRRPRNIVFMPDGSRGYVNAENDGTVVIFDAVSNKKIGEIRLGEAGVIKPMGLVLSLDSKHLYVSTGRGRKVFVIDTATNESVASFEVGTRPWGIGVSPDGKKLYTANGPSNDVSVIDIESRSVIKKVGAGRSPWGILIIDKGR